MGEIIKPGIMLLVLTVAAALILSVAHGLTTDIAENQEKKVAIAIMKELLPGAVRFDEEAIDVTSAVDSLFTAFDDSGAAGYIIGVTEEGYSGRIHMLVGVDTKGIVRGVKITGNTETPGLGTECEEPYFLRQFLDQSGPFAVIKRGTPDTNEIQIITSATITSEAVAAGVNKALEYYSGEVAQ